VTENPDHLTYDGDSDLLTGPPEFDDEFPVDADPLRGGFRGYHKKIETKSIQIRAYRSGPADASGRRGKVILEIPSPNDEVVRAIVRGSVGTQSKLGFTTYIYHGQELLPMGNIAEEEAIDIPNHAAVPGELQGLREWFQQEYDIKRREIERMEEFRATVERESLEAVRAARDRAAVEIAAAQRQADAEIKDYRESVKNERAVIDVELQRLRERTHSMIEHETKMQEEIAARQLNLGELANGNQKSILEEAERQEEMRRHLRAPADKEDGVIDKLVQAAENESVQKLFLGGLSTIAGFLQKK